MKFELNAQKREVQGSGASRRLRHAGKVPGIIYGGSTAPEVVELDHNELLLSLRKEAFHSSLITLKLDGAEQNVLLRDAQMHPYKPLVLHVDFQRVDVTRPIHQKVPLHFINADIAPGVKIGGGKVAQIMNEIDVACLPQDLPAFIEVDLKDMKAGQSLHISQLTFPQGVKPVVHGDDLVVVSVIGKKKGSEEAEGEAAA
ncbi:50S ribosomal protein L25/general stress protein Ctc [Propionivibrio limicola]|uniref:50S ribosomal protein L25/general stress protein Ctc n=1 Tax=Propionivibrio limicola TaxID=167645 RepID=UPI0012914797|nr:50S ribosomal protein L25/general stress protein Ctc [Propionivibrio limicola]